MMLLIDIRHVPIRLQWNVRPKVSTIPIQDLILQSVTAV